MQKNFDKMFFTSEIIAYEIGCIKVSILRREYLPLTVNVLTNSPKCLYTPKRDFFQLNCLQSY